MLETVVGRWWRRSRRLGAAPRRFAWPTTLTEESLTGRGLARGVRTVTLRPLRCSDEVAWRRLRLADDARLRPWEATIPPGTGEELHRFRQYVRLQSRQARRGDAMPFVIEADGDFAGQLTVAPIHWGSLSAASLGYWIGSPWEGRGLVTLSAAMVLDHLLGPEVGLHRVEIDVRPENARSLAVCRRLGLHEEGLRRGLMHIDGAWADHLSFAVLAEDVAGQPGFVARLAERGAERWAWSRGSDAVGSALWRLRRS